MLAMSMGNCLKETEPRGIMECIWGGGVARVNGVYLFKLSVNVPKCLDVGNFTWFLAISVGSRFRRTKVE